MRRFLLLASVGFLGGLIASACGNHPPKPSCNTTSCEGCCDDQDVCRKGDQGPSCGSGGFACNVCSGGQVCVATICTFVTVDAGGNDAGADAGTDGGAPRCGSTAVSCSDQVSADLDLKTTVNAAAITNAADGVGYKSTIDSRGGGLTPSMSYVYAKFTDTGLVKVDLSDEAALLSLGWDIAFRRFVIRLNGGSSGPSCVDAAKTTAGTSFDALTAPPGGLGYAVDDFVGPPAPTDAGAADAGSGCLFKDDGSGLPTSPSTALAGFYAYAGCVSMSSRVFIVRTRLGRDVKLLVTSYYDTEANQTLCNAGTPSGGAFGGTVRVRWSFLD